MTVSGLDLDSPQGDKQIVGLLERFGAQVSCAADHVTVGPGQLRGCAVDVGDVPDLLPILAVLAAFAAGETRFQNGARLRDKESDRLAATAALLRGLGGAAQELPDGLIVRGNGLVGGVADSCHDHRIAMAAAVAAIGCREAVLILDAGAVNKSYPHFFDDYRSIGGIADVL